MPRPAWEGERRGDWGRSPTNQAVDGGSRDLRTSDGKASKRTADALIEITGCLKLTINVWVPPGLGRRNYGNSDAPNLGLCFSRLSFDPALSLLGHCF